MIDVRDKFKKGFNKEGGGERIHWNLLHWLIALNIFFIKKENFYVCTCFTIDKNDYINVFLNVWIRIMGEI